MDRKKIKFLFAINHLGIGGAETMMVEQANFIDKERFDPYILSLYRNPENNIAARIELPEGRYVQFAFRNIYDIASWWKLYRWMRRERFDCVLTNLFDTNVVVRSLAVLTGVPCILSYEHNIDRDKKRRQIVVDRILAKWNYRILVGAPQVKDFVVAQEKIPAGKIEVVFDAAHLTFGHAKDERAAVLRKMHLPEEYLYVVAAGSFTEQKGHAYLIDAWRQVLARYKNTDVRLKLIIFGSGELKESLERRVKEYGLENDIVMPGIAPMKDIVAISDIFSLISLWEGFSIALIQAMNAACAIVATKVSGSVDAIADGVDGLLVAPYDASAAAAAFIRFIDDPALRHTLGQSAQKKSALYDIRNKIKEIEALAQNGLRSARK